MKKAILLAGAMTVAALGSTAQAATIISPTGATSVVDLTTATHKNLGNNGFYASGSNAIAYLFSEGTNTAATNATTTAFGIAGDPVQSFLLHYDRKDGSGLFGGLTTGTAIGSFTIALGAHQVLVGIAGYTGNFLDSLANANALRDTDMLSGVTYPNTSFTSALFRGTEGTLFGDTISYVTTGNQIKVNYKLTTTGSSLDEARFLIGTSAVPEPASWAMMIGGFGLVGAAMRRRRTRTSVAFA